MRSSNNAEVVINEAVGAGRARDILATKRVLTPTVRGHDPLLRSLITYPCGSGLTDRT